MAVATSNGENDKTENKPLDYDVLENIISIYVHGQVKNPLIETQEAALRRQALCLKLQRMSWLFRSIAERQLFVHLHFRSIEAVIKFSSCMQIAPPKAFLDKVRMYTRCVSFGYAFDAYDTSPEYTLAVTTIKSILETCGERLRGFRQLGPYMSPLPAPLWKTLRTRCLNLEYLDGFGFCLDAGSQTGQTFIQHLIAFRKLQRLTTSVVWLPPTFIPEVRRPILLTEEEKRRSGLLDRKYQQRFAQLESLRTPLVQWDNLLVEALLIADLPKLRNLKLGMWESETVFRFLEKHGSKLVSIDLLLCRWSIWPWTGDTHRMSTLVRTPQKFQIEHLFEYCPHLRYMTLHQNQALAGLVNRAGLSKVKPGLEMLCLGSNDDGSYAAMLEYQPLNEMSFSFINTEELELTEKLILATDWKSLFPHLREIVVYWPRASSLKALDAEDKDDEETHKNVGRDSRKPMTRVVATQSIQVWREVLEKQAVSLLFQGPPLETA
ncbi:hypothetical protein QFC22_001127 [Naganishia vaughanmartiniae]|uniref:Uncharacterized protein n=1 Tax=Naganishia vaughanmartiniae TaxID=1424756 RepID=A0ACC2XK44_9TREE|nr:hypothetical protein QFC22_001127 [Naganishia vaughanmartiniae]